MPRFDIPELPPSGPLLPPDERRERSQTLEWMHEMAAPHRKKRVDPRETFKLSPERMRAALGDFHEYE